MKDFSFTRFLIPAAMFAACVFTDTDASACTNLIAGRKATADGSVMTTYADDSHTRFGDLYHAARGKHAPGSVRKIIDWGSDKPLGRFHRWLKPSMW